MTTHNDLWIAARARMALIEHELAAMQRTPKQPAPGNRLEVALARALHRASTLLLSIGGWLDCRADRLLAEARGKGLDEGIANPC